MYTCTFFGHRNTPEAIKNKLKKTIIYLIENEQVTEFLVGNNGMFDSIVKMTLAELSNAYPITYFIVLSTLPKDNKMAEHSILPKDFEKFPPKFAIDKRNEYMLKKSDFVVCYTSHYLGGAGKFTEKAIKKNKRVINLYSKAP